MSEVSSSKPNFSMFPLLWLASCFAFGVFCSKVSHLDWKFYCAITSICLFSAFALRNRQFAVTLILIGFAGLGALHFAIGQETLEANRVKNLFESKTILSGDPVEIEGTVAREPEMLVAGRLIFVKTDRVTYKSQTFSVTGNVRLFVNISNEETNGDFESLNLQHGGRIIAACELKREDKFLNPGVISYKEILDQQEIDATCSVKSPLLLENPGVSPDIDPIGAIFRFRIALIAEFRNSFNHSTSSILIASLLGNKYFLDKRTAEVFREGGTFHVLVISGLHITFIGGLLLLLVRIFTKNKLVQFLISCSVLWAYAIAVGAEVPVVRAALMFTILLFPLVINRKGTLLNSFGASILILLIWRPNDLFSPSFHLTIVSVASIIMIAFPLIEKFRAIGAWSPTVTTPFPPIVSEMLKRLCEMVYWREDVWKREVSRQIWKAKIEKSPLLPSIAKRGLQNVAKFFAEGLIVSLVVQICLLPFLGIYFNRFSVFGVVLNLWVGAGIAVESFAAILALLVKQINHSISVPLIKIAEFLNWALLAIPQILIDLDIASLRIPEYSGNLKAIYFLYFIPIIAFAIFVNKWNPFALTPRSGTSQKKLPVALILIGVTLSLSGIIIFHPFSEPPPNGRLRIDFLDVGQGDSALITFPNGETMLVDGGGKLNFDNNDSSDYQTEETEAFEPDAPSIGEAVVSKFLWNKGYSHVDYIVATHSDADHMQGLIDVANNFSIGTAYFGRTPFQDPEFEKFKTTLERKSITSTIVSRGDVINFGEAKVEVLYPNPDNSFQAISDNNHSIVLRISLGNRKFLLTGDIEKETETLLVSNTNLEADVVKVAHHGSRTSSILEFISATKAAYAIIPVGRSSLFGHPHREVVDRWQNTGAKTFTTGQNGTISFSTNGIDLEIETYVK